MQRIDIPLGIPYHPYNFWYECKKNSVWRKDF